MAVDLLLTGARIVDGTGAPWYDGAVVVNDGRIVETRREQEPEVDAEQVIDVDGSVICPGFVDTHSHSDLELFEDRTLSAKVRQGITTEVLGQDGFSMAPMYREGGEEEWQKHLGALAGRVEKEWTWGSLAEYCDEVESSGVAPNVATLVGHGTVRFNVMGMEDRTPDEDELEEMRSLVAEALEDGAVGFSTGLIYTPCSYADTEEVRLLAAELQPFGRPFVAHIRSEGRWIWSALDEFVDIGDELGVPLHLSHFKVAGREQQGKAGRAIDLIETARERGVDITVEQYPYRAGSTMLSALMPPWVHSEGPDRALEHLRSAASRAQIREDIENWGIDGWENVGGLVGWEHIAVASVQTEKNQSVEGERIADIAKSRGTDPIETVCDLLVEEELGASMRIHQLTESDVQDILRYERVNVATDGLFGGKPHPRVYGTYPKILGKYVREENLLTLEEAIRKMTSLPARSMGLESKGLVRPGMDADLVVLDPKTVESRATYDRPNRFPKGISDVVVNGEFVVRDGETTGTTPGSVIRAGVE